MSLAARIAAGLALVLALVAGAWRIHTQATAAGDAAGYARAQAEYAALALAASEAARQQEQALAATTKEIDRAHQAEKARLRAAASAAAERLQHFQAAADAATHSATPADPAPAGRVADPFPAIAGECARALVEMDAHAGRLAGTLGALQDYTRRVRIDAPDTITKGAPHAPD